MSTLAIDIGGTKFSMAVFEAAQIRERASRGTDRAGGREWMLEQISSISAEWNQRCVLDWIMTRTPECSARAFTEQAAAIGRYSI